MDGANEEKLSWFARLFRKHAKLTYWLGDDAYTAEICHFSERTPDCIVFKDYVTQKATVVRYHTPIVYVLEQIK